MAQESYSRDLDKVIVRLPDGMRDHLKAVAASNGRSVNAEIVARLQLTLDSALGDLNAIGVQALANRLDASTIALETSLQNLFLELRLAGGMVSKDEKPLINALERYAEDIQTSKSSAARTILTDFLKANGYLKK